MLTLMEALRVQEGELENLAKVVLGLAEDLAPLLAPTEELAGVEEMVPSDCDAVLAVKRSNRTIKVIAEELRDIRARLRVGAVEPAEEEASPCRTREEALALLVAELKVWPLDEGDADVTPYGWSWKNRWLDSPPILAMGENRITRDEWRAARTEPASLTREQAIAWCRDHMAKAYIWPSTDNGHIEPVIPSPVGWRWDWVAPRAQWVLVNGEGVVYLSDVSLTRDQAIAWCRQPANLCIWPTSPVDTNTVAAPPGWLWKWHEASAEWVLTSGPRFICQSDVDVSLRGAVD